MAEVVEPTLWIAGGMGSGRANRANLWRPRLRRMWTTRPTLIAGVREAASARGHLQSRRGDLEGVVLEVCTQ